MFKLLTDGPTPLWNFDPSGDATHTVEFEVTIPELETETLYVDDHKPSGS